MAEPRETTQQRFRREIHEEARQPGYCKNCGGDGYLSSEQRLDRDATCPACKGTGNA